MDSHEIINNFKQSTLPVVHSREMTVQVCTTAVCPPMSIWLPVALPLPHTVARGSLHASSSSLSRLFRRPYRRSVPEILGTDHPGWFPKTKGLSFLCRTYNLSTQMR